MTATAAARPDTSTVPAKRSPLATARRLAENTPETRNRYVDLLRALSILVVVFGHWLMAAPEMVDGDLRIGHLIAEARWAQWATWVLQVMPVFFFVGGFSNAGAWRAARRNGTLYGHWLRDRLRRLILPVLPVLAVWTIVASAALQTDIDRSLLKLGSQAALVPVWFLATYVLIVAVAPVTLRLWERFGWGAFWATAGVAAVVDFANLGLGLSITRWTNYVFVWNAVHFLGYAWADGRIGTSTRRLQTALAGFTSLAVLVALFPYPLAMVGLDNAAVTNSNPPKITLIALGVFQFGLAMMFEPVARKWLENIRVWTAVVAVNASIMSLYLWHLTAMVAVLAMAYGLGGVGFGYEVNSLSWWVTRPLFLTVMVAATAPFVIGFARFERPSRDRREAPATWKPIFAVLLVCAGLGLLARNGVANADGLNVVGLALPFIGVTFGRVVGAPTGDVV